MVPRFRDLALQPREEFAPGRAVLVQRQAFRDLRLGGAQEGGELGNINTILTVVVVPAAAAPARASEADCCFTESVRCWRIAWMPRQRGAYQAF